MFLENQTRVVRFTKCRLKTDAEGNRWATPTMVLRMDDKDDALSNAMKRQAKLMGDDKGIDLVKFNETVEGCRLSFRPAVGKGEDAFDAVELSDFTLEREKVPASTGTLEKKPTGALLLAFSFTLPLAGSGAWIMVNFGTDLKIKVQRTQRELALEPNSEEGGTIEEKATQIQRSLAEAAASESPAKRKRGRPLKLRRK